MNLQLYIYNCGNCGNTFKSPELPGDPYGEFLMHSVNGEIAYLSSFKDAVFQEIESFFERSELLNNMDKINRVKIFHNIFGVACDPASDSSNYQIGRDPRCPKCHSNNKLSWHPTNPPEIIDMQINLVTHNNWNKLNQNQKEEILNNAIKSFFK